MRLASFEIVKIDESKEGQLYWWDSDLDGVRQKNEVFSVTAIDGKADATRVRDEFANKFINDNQRVIGDKRQKACFQFGEFTSPDRIRIHQSLEDYLNVKNGYYDRKEIADFRIKLLAFFTEVLSKLKAYAASQKIPSHHPYRVALRELETLRDILPKVRFSYGPSALLFSDSWRQNRDAFYNPTTNTIHLNSIDYKGQRPFSASRIEVRRLERPGIPLHDLVHELTHALIGGKLGFANRRTVLTARGQSCRFTFKIYPETKKPSSMELKLDFGKKGRKLVYDLYAEYSDLEPLRLDRQKTCRPEASFRSSWANEAYAYQAQAVFMMFSADVLQSDKQSHTPYWKLIADLKTGGKKAEHARTAIKQRDQTNPLLMGYFGLAGEKAEQDLYDLVSGMPDYQQEKAAKDCIPI